MPYKYEWRDHIPNGIVNKAIADWFAERPDAPRKLASPSTVGECPRVVWLRAHGVPPTNEIGWGKRQRFMLGRLTEDLLAKQLQEAGKLLWAWPDNYAGQSAKFVMGEGLGTLTGTPDLLLRIGDGVAISDAKTSRADSFAWVPINPAQVWKDPYWNRYRLQLIAYYMLSHANPEWFEKRNLPLPTHCHLFSYALDDGIVRRELTWQPRVEDVAEVERLTERWNRAYASEQMPDCTCVAEGIVKFCPYSIVPKGSKVGTVCCHAELESFRAGGSL